MVKYYPSGKYDLKQDGKGEGNSCAQNLKNSVLNIPFRGTQAAIIGEANSHGGYARVSVLNRKGKTLYSSLIDFYSKYPESAIRIVTPNFTKGNIF